MSLIYCKMSENLERELFSSKTGLEELPEHEFQYIAGGAAAPCGQSDPGGDTADGPDCSFAGYTAAALRGMVDGVQNGDGWTGTYTGIANHLKDCNDHGGGSTGGDNSPCGGGEK